MALARYEMKFMFDWGCDTCVWSTNDAAREKYHDYPVDLSELPISTELLRFLEELCGEHNKALDWECPSNGLIWSEEEIELFSQKAKRGYERLCQELGPEYHVIIWNEKSKYPFM